MKTSHSFRKKLLSASVASVLGLAASGPLHADTYEFSFVGAFTMIGGSGSSVKNSPSPYTSGTNDPYAWLGNRTPITGTMTYDTTAGSGTLTINGFHFFGAGNSDIAVASGITVQSIGNGTCTNNTFPPSGCQSGNLFLGNMLFSWNKAVYPVSTIWDATGFLGALSASTPGTVINAVGALPGSNSLNFGGKTYPLGPTPIAVTDSNTTLTPACSPPPGSCAGVNPSGTTPPLTDTISGSPIIGTSFSGFSPNFDIMKLTVTKKNGISAAPILQTKAPADGATSVTVATTVTLSFTNSMDATLVAGAFSLKDAGGATVAGTLSPNTGNASNFTFTPTANLSYKTTYTATVTSAALDVANQPLSGAPVVWTFTTAAQIVAGPACTPVAQVPVGGNFTMLNGDGDQVGGTNDIAYQFTFDPDNIQPGDLNTSVSGTKFNMTLASTTPEPFFGHTWTAHDIRVFGPGDYSFDTTCTIAQIRAGTAVCNNPLGQGQTQQFLKMHVGTGQLGAHMLFDWNKAANINVVNVWSRNQAWNINPLNLSKSDSAFNAMWTGAAWGGPAGVAVNPNTTWKFVSTDPDGDGNNGVAMVNGSFIGFNANFNLGASNSCQSAAPTPITVGGIGSASATGCSISTKPSSITIFERSDWLLVGGFLAWLGALRFRIRRVTKG